MITSDLVGDHLGGLNELAGVLGRTHKVWEAPTSGHGRFSGLLTWDALNTLLATHRLEPPRLRLARDGDTVAEHLYCTRRTPRRMPAYWHPHPDLLAEQLRGGATLVLDAIEEMHPPVAAVAAGLERTLRLGVQANLYASWTSTEGFGTHWDDHDVIVVQVAGAKRWRIYGSTRTAPLYRDVTFDTEVPTKALDAFTLRAGDVLHVPRGCWHAAAASGAEPSLHLTFGLATRTGADLLGWVLDRLRAEEIVRRDVPVYAGGAERASWRRELLTAVSAALADPCLIDAFVTGRDALEPASGAFALPYAVTGLPQEPDLRVCLAVPRAVLEVGATVVSLSAAGRRWDFAPAAAPVLEALATGRQISLAEIYALCPDLAPHTLRTLVQRLIADGIATVRSGT